jgi:hypothetical protein
VDDKYFARATAAPRNRDLNRHSQAWPDTEVLGHALVTEKSRFLSSQDRGHPQAFLAELFSSDRVHASMDLMKPACFQPVADGSLRVPQVE